MPHRPGDGRRAVDELWQIVVRHRWLILACALTAVGIAYVRHRMITPVWQASTTIRIDDGAAASMVSPQMSILGAPGADQIETEMLVLRSHTFAEAIVGTLALQVQLGELRGVRRDRTLGEIRIAPTVAPGEYRLVRSGDVFELRDAEGDPLARAAVSERIEHAGFGFTILPEALRHETIPLEILPAGRAARSLIGDLNVQRPSAEVTAIEIQYQSSDPGLAASVPNAYAERFLVERQRQQRTQASSTVAFLQEQIDSLAVQLVAAEETLRSFQEREEIVSLDAQSGVVIGHLAGLQAQRDALQSQRLSLGETLQKVESEVDESTGPSPYRDLASLPHLVATPTVSSLLVTLTQLEDQLAALRPRRTPEDPDVVALRQRMEEVERQLHTVAITHQEALSVQIGSIEASLAQNAGILGTLPRKQVAMARLQREAMLLQQVYTLLQTRLKESQIAEAVQDPSASIVDPAAIRQGPVQPGPLSRRLLLALVVGTAIGLAGAYLLEWRDRTVRSRDEVKSILGAPVVGLIPSFGPEQRKIEGGIRQRVRALVPTRPENDGTRIPRTFTTQDERHAVAEAFRSLRTNITFTAAEDAPRTVLIVSAMPGDGKTTATVNLAAAFVRQGLRTLVIDADMRRGVIHNLFGIAREPGLSNVLIDGSTADESIQKIEIGIQAGISVLPGGTIPPNPSELLASERFDRLLKELHPHFDHILIDTPPLSLVTDASLLATRSDCVLMVVRAGHTQEEALYYASEQLLHVGARVRGAILNDVSAGDSRYGMYDYTYGYSYSSTTEDAGA